MELTGNIIGSTLSADVFARYQRQRNLRVLYVSTRSALEDGRGADGKTRVGGRASHSCFDEGLRLGWREGLLPDLVALAGQRQELTELVKVLELGRTG